MRKTATHQTATAGARHLHQAGVFICLPICAFSSPFVPRHIFAMTSDTLLYSAARLQPAPGFDGAAAALDRYSYRISQGAARQAADFSTPAAMNIFMSIYLSGMKKKRRKSMSCL